MDSKYLGIGGFLSVCSSQLKA